MENVDFSGSSDITQLITQEKKVDEPQMMEFSSSIEDLMPTAPITQDVYTNPSNNRVAGLSLPNEPISQKKKNSGNPFNLTDDQFNAVIAGAVSVVVFSTLVQTKLAGIVPNFAGMNGNIASAMAAAVLFYFAHRFAKNR